jgi:2-polyprenyl-3-methyl-5-hydroxy-6-metoxy-1,4-benzoquinol methylase
VAEPGSAREWALALYGRSVLKQRKLSELARALGPTVGLRCLDLGSDNGVVSLLLRERGGSWASADLTAQAVESIRSLVGSDVHLVDARRLPFADAEFDRVAVVDMLEHAPDEAAFARELARITKPGGRLIVNTPHLKHRCCAASGMPWARPTRSTATCAPATRGPGSRRSSPASRSRRTAATRASSRSSWTPC